MTITKIICPFHDEETPSCAVYLDELRYHCYGGSCGKSGPLSEIAEHLDEVLRELALGGKPKNTIKNPVNVMKIINDIERLPHTMHRGFLLPHDDEGYYLIWPQRNYYLKRFYDTEKHPGKYKGPAGVQRPPYIMPGDKEKPWVIIEGEFNAKSIASVIPSLNVVSPGGVTSFKLSHLASIQAELKSASRIIIVADDDVPGVTAIIKLRAELVALNPTARINSVLMSDDANSIFERHARLAANVYKETLRL